MPRRRITKAGEVRWQAQRRHDGVVFHLGTYSDKGTAEQAEREFRNLHPRYVGGYASPIIQEAMALVGVDMVEKLWANGIGLKKRQRCR